MSKKDGKKESEGNQTILTSKPGFQLPILFLVLLPSSIYTLLYIELKRETLFLSIIFYFIGLLCESAGYHRLWAHRSYIASAPLKIFLAFFGAGNLRGSIKEWAKIHRYHHRNLDTDKDPFNRKNGFFFAFLGHTFQDLSKLDTSHMEDLDNDWVVKLQDFIYPILSVGMGWILPAAIAYQWEDHLGGLCYAGIVRTFVFQIVGNFLWALNRTYGHQPYNENVTARNNVLVSILTLGEGYLNYHYEFPSDYRIGCFYYHFDPIKWLIRFWGLVGLASGLKKTNYTEVLRVRIQKKQEKLDKLKETIDFGPALSSLPVWTMETVDKKVSQGQMLLIIDNIVHDVGKFLSEHPGGEEVIKPKIGKDATVAFNGGVQRHSKAARNLAALMRVAILAKK